MPAAGLTKSLVARRTKHGGSATSDAAIAPPTGSSHFRKGSTTAPGISQVYPSSTTAGTTSSGSSYSPTSTVSASHARHAARVRAVKRTAVRNIVKADKTQQRQIAKQNKQTEKAIAKTLKKDKPLSQHERHFLANHIQARRDRVLSPKKGTGLTAKGPKSGKLGLTKQVKKVKKVAVPTGGGLSRNQQMFAGALSKKTGLDPRIVASWMVAEEPAGEKINPATGNQNWLNIGFPGHITPAAQNPRFNKPVKAGKATSAWIKGKFDPGNWQAASSITSELGHLKGASPQEFGARLAASGWGTDAANAIANVGSFGIKKKKVKGVSGGSAKPTPTRRRYQKPFVNATQGRTDMGVDFTGSGAIRAIGKAKVVQTGASGWPNGGAGPSGQGVLYQLLDGPKKGKHVYVYEGVTPTVKAGQVVKAGQQIAKFYPGSSIEIGWSDSTGAPLSHDYYTEGLVTKEGTHFSKFLGRVQGKRPTIKGGKPVYTSTTGSVPSTGVSTSTGVTTGTATGTTAAAPTATGKARSPAKNRALSDLRARIRAAVGRNEALLRERGHEQKGTEADFAKRQRDAEDEITRLRAELVKVAADSRAPTVVRRAPTKRARSLGL